MDIATRAVEKKPLEEHHAALVERACRLLETADQALRLTELADAVGVSPSHLHRLFKGVTGVTPAAYAASLRARRIRDGLRPGVTVTTALHEAGYTSAAAFHAEAPGRLGMTPARYRAGGADTDIRFAVGQSSLGALLVAASPVGICAIALGDDPEQLVRELQDRFPRARLIGDDPEFAGHMALIAGLLDAPGPGADRLPLDIRGTAFQQRVWAALMQIPPGSTVSYTDLARQLGMPRAVRAVAGACAANVLAVAIPCHRVVRSDGALAGYRWGIARKAELLRRESGGRPSP
ncbi:methylated-DNA--[protein]-cysteine S-methyltransferase [Zoogloea sp.]|uniref:methylated-DNA--[protein]-cysteine S-methyltransferase n=1 Tax=Zoogloea sp. TaxID=49181 RepID=UPI001415CF71|nr:MAG: methylated-DNA--[protein]-cysteine S-methyltransferase [Zoogloea sp.]